MNGDKQELFAYLLIDNGLLQEVSASYREADATSRPTWLLPIYADRALEVSPFLIDIEAAYDAGAIGEFMGFLNARRPALHVSIIETGLDSGRLAQHLRRFIFIVDPEGKQFTLRFADCAVLAPLSSILTSDQWATMSGPISRWLPHDRSGFVTQLPPSDSSQYVSMPLRLDRAQLKALDEASEPDHSIAKVRMMRHGESMPGSAAEQHAWACAARQVWRAANNQNALFLTALTEAALMTRGRVLGHEGLEAYIAMDDIDKFRARLKKLIHQTQVGQGN